MEAVPSSSGGPDALRSAIEAARAAIARRRALGRHETRALLIALGERLLSPDGVASENEVEQARALLRDERGEFQETLESEMRMAITEYLQSVDPRYIDLPDYDFHYTVEARSRLESRLVAADALGFSIDAALRERIGSADGLLEAALERREAGLPPERPQP